MHKSLIFIEYISLNSMMMMLIVMTMIPYIIYGMKPYYLAHELLPFKTLTPYVRVIFLQSFVSAFGHNTRKPSILFFLLLIIRYIT